MKRKFNLMRNAAMVLIVLGFSACSKEKMKPILDVKFTMEKTDQFEYAEGAFSQLFLYGVNDEKDTFISNLQNMKNMVMGGFLLENGGTLNMTKQTHFEMEVVALKPDVSLYLHLTKSGTVQKVWEKIGDGKIYLDHPVTINADEEYEVKFIMNTEKAVVLKNNKLAIDWSKVTVKIIKK